VPATLSQVISSTPRRTFLRYSERGKTMPQLTLISLKCVNKQDTEGKDTVVLRVDAKKPPTRYGPFPMGKGDVRKLGFDDDFDQEVDIHVGDVDGKPGGDNDDAFGKITAKASQAGAGVLTGIFDKKKGTDYHLKYRVS
jgi:hypothetical protein